MCHNRSPTFLHPVARRSGAVRGLYKLVHIPARFTPRQPMARVPFLCLGKYYNFFLCSQAFKKSHGGGGGGEGKDKGNVGNFVVVAGGMSKIGELIVEPPVPSLYYAPIIEPVPPEHQGGLWDFEDEPSYFDGDM